MIFEWVIALTFARGSHVDDVIVVNHIHTPIHTTEYKLRGIYVPLDIYTYILKLHYIHLLCIRLLVPVKGASPWSGCGSITIYKGCSL